MSRHQSAFSLSATCRMGSSVLTMSDFSDVVNGEMKRDSTSCALIAAMRSGEQDLAVLALKHGDNINHRNRQGQTALHVALEHGREDMCLWLLSRGADPYISDSAGRDCAGWAEDAMGLTSAQQVCVSPACMLFFSCAEWVWIISGSHECFEMLVGGLDNVVFELRIWLRSFSVKTVGLQMIVLCSLTLQAESRGEDAFPVC